MNFEDIRSFRKVLRSLERLLGWQLKSETECCGVTVSQCHIIIELGNRGETSMVDLSSVLGLDTSTLSRSINGMVNLGLVNRVTNPDDRRYVTLSLSDQGMKVYDNIEQMCNTHYFKVLSLIPEEKRHQVVESFSIFSEVLLRVKNEEDKFDCCRDNGGGDCGKK